MDTLYVSNGFSETKGHLLILLKIVEEINVISLSWWKKLGPQFFIKIYILNKLCAKFHAFFHHESEMTLILSV